MEVEKAQEGDGVEKTEATEKEPKDATAAAEDAPKDKVEGDKEDKNEESKDENKKEEKEKEKEKPAAAVDIDEETLKTVAGRLRFFFSDANLRQDFFMRCRLTGYAKSQNPNKKGNEAAKTYPKQVLVEDLLRFNTIKKYTQSPAVLIQAAVTHLADVLVVSDDCKAMGRVVPFTMDMMDGNIPVSLRLGNLPVNTSENGNKQKQRTSYAVRREEVEHLFCDYPGLAMVQLRFRYPDRNNNHQENKRAPRIPKGTAYVEFETKEAMEQAAADFLTMLKGEKVTPKKKLLLGDQELQVMYLQEHMDAKPHKKRKRDKEEAEEGKEDSVEEEGDKDDDKKKQGAEKEEFVYKLDWKPGFVIQMKGLPADCNREAIVEGLVQAHGCPVEKIKEVVHIDYSRGQETGAIRYYKPPPPLKDAAASASAADDKKDDDDKEKGEKEGGKNDDKDKEGDTKDDDDDEKSKLIVQELAQKINAGDITFSGTKVESATVLQGEEEQKYYDEFIKFKTQQMKQHKQQRGGGGRNHHHHHHNNHNNHHGGGGGVKGRHHNNKRHKRR